MAAETVGFSREILIQTGFAVSRMPVSSRHSREFLGPIFNCLCEFRDDVTTRDVV